MMMFTPSSRSILYPRRLPPPEFPAQPFEDVIEACLWAAPEARQRRHGAGGLRRRRARWGRYVGSRGHPDHVGRPKLPDVSGTVPSAVAAALIDEAPHQDLPHRLRHQQVSGLANTCRPSTVCALSTVQQQIVSQIWNSAPMATTAHSESGGRARARRQPRA